ncbi:hypothetical protein FIBSPDRAFT_813379 [Athelia psychrophila]|uniref:C2 domain-containing protein n=1 Tax=Athelia psychrophila TaxID=1759441 RepID=A0A166UJK6_9AGAM|nr:hypothetical protein FIBSPDRAFT_813379 [Fibularhizoctonia sp. CBS 109695]
MNHHFGEGYSGARPVPTVDGYLKQQQENSTDSINYDRSLPPTPAAVPSSNAPPPQEPPSNVPASQPPSTHTGTSDKERILAQSKKQTPLEQAQAKKRDGQLVDDPTTGGQVHLEPSKPPKDKETYGKQLDPANMDHAGPALTPPQVSPPPTERIAPHAATPSNILLQQFPPPVEPALLNNLTARLRQLEYGVLGGSVLVWVCCAFGNGFWVWLLRSTVLGAAALGIVIALHLVERQILRNLAEVRMHMERQRGEQHSPPTPESVEWLNGILATVWPLIPGDMFTGLTDTIEDVMQASLPKFVTAVRIADLGQGRNPLRIVAMRALPDQQGSRLKHGDDWIDQGQNPGTSAPQNGDGKDPQATQEESDAAKLAKDDAADQAGDFVNMEVSLAYVSVPKKAGQAIHADNAHLQLEFFVGLAGWARIPIRIWVEIGGIVATVRVRLQMVEQLPFVRNCTVTLMGTPYVDVSAVPLSRVLPNVLDLPLVSGFVQSSIAAACQMYQAPQSITMDLAQLLMGDGTKKDTRAIGVLQITVHHATSLAAADSNGKSDPYVVAAWSKFGKPLYSTRVMVADLNPVWEETFFLLVTADEVTSEERLSIQLWDSDARSADDVLGRVEVDLLEIMKASTEGKKVRRADKLRGFEESENMPGEVHWSYAFFRKVPLKSEMKDAADATRAGLNGEKAQPDMQPSAVDTPVEKQALDTPPDPAYPSGIFSIIVQNINNLENQNLIGAKGRNMKAIAGKPGQPTADDAELETHEDLPSSYCEIMINDDLVYRTRTKEMTSAPYFAAGTERFVRDYRSTVVRVAVRDARMREHDALLGVVTLPLGELFKTQSQVTRLFSLQDGVGFGRVNISLLFKAVDVQLPRELCGWETGTVEVLSDLRASGVGEAFAGQKVVLKTTDDVEKISGSAARADASDVVWDIAAKDGAEERRLPVYHRYASALVVEIGKNAMAVLWLQDVADGEVRDVELDIMRGEHMQQLEQCYISPHAKDNHAFEVIGKLRFKVRFDPGLDEDHEKLATDQQKQHSMDTYLAAEGMNAQIEKARSGRGDDDAKTPREKELERRDLHRRGRGVMQVKPMRTLKWMGDGFKSKTRDLKDKIKPGNSAPQPDVETEV